MSTITETETMKQFLGGLQSTGSCYNVTCETCTLGPRSEFTRVL